MLAHPDASRCAGGTDRNIVFVNYFSETKHISVCVSRADEICSWIEAVVELLLVAAGVAGVIAAVIDGFF